MSKNRKNNSVVTEETQSNERTETMTKNTNQKIEEMMAHIASLEAQLAEATARKSKSSHRKYEVLEILKTKAASTAELAIALNTTKNNIGSLLTYLRKQDGVILHRDHEGRHYIPKSAE